MRFPQTVAPFMFLMSPSARFVTFNSSLAVSSVVERISGKAISQASAAAQPTWGGATLAGPYLAANWPGSRGIAGLTYSGAQSLEFDVLANFPSMDGYGAMTICCVASCTNPAGGTAQTVWCLGSAGATPTLALQYQSGSLKFTEVNSNGTYTASASIDSGLHVITASRTAAGAMSLRVDGLPVASTSAVLSGDAFTTFCLGAVNSNGAQSAFLTGAMGDVAIFGAAPADIDTVEGFLLQQTGLVRSFTNA